MILRKSENHTNVAQPLFLQQSAPDERRLAPGARCLASDLRPLAPGARCLASDALPLTFDPWHPAPSAGKHAKKNNKKQTDLIASLCSIGTSKGSWQLCEANLPFCAVVKRLEPFAINYFTEVIDLTLTPFRVRLPL